MKIPHTFLIFFLSLVVTRGAGITQEKSSPLEITCSNAFEWQFNCDFRNTSFGFGINGLGNDDRLEFLYDPDRLYYHPEIKNTQLDFTSIKRWELRISVSVRLR